MLRSWWQNAVGVVLFLVIASCSGGGCTSGCSSCGITPLAGGFPRENTIPNAGAVRLTRPGLDFVQANISTLTRTLITSSGGVIKFPIPKSDGSTTGVTYTICSSGPDETSSPPKCIAEIDIGHAKLHLDAVRQFDPGGGDIITKPGLVITGTIPVRVQNLPVHFSVIGISVNPEIGVGSGDCNSGHPQHSGQGGFDYRDFPVTMYLPIVKETIPPRDGFAKIDTKDAIVNPSITSDDVAICEDCTVVPIIGQPVCNAVFGAVKNAVFGTLIGGVKDQLKGAIQGANCTKAADGLTPACPTGSHSNATPSTDPDAGPATGGTCVYDADATTCVPIELGTEGHLELGSALRSISPGTSGALDFMLAAGGDMDPAPNAPADANNHTTNGLTLGLLGGALAQPLSDCVPAAANPMPTGIPIPDELLKDKQTPWAASDPDGPHVGIALAGRYLTYAMGSAYGSGLLCLGVSSEQVAQLSSGLLSVLIPSIKLLTFEQRGAAAAAIATRPQSLPTVSIGTGADLKKNALINIKLSKFAIDFYIWSDERFIRAFTFESDMTVPVNLQTAVDPAKNPKGGLLPVIGDLIVENGKVTNSTLITEDPALMANALGSILGGITGQFVGSIGAIDLSGALSSLGMTLTIPDGSIRKVSKGSDDFIAIFANLALPPATPGTPIVHANTRAELVSKVVHPEAMGLTTADKTKLPALHVTFASPEDDGTRAIEYSWRIDEGTWSAWSPERSAVIQNDTLFFQGKHVLSVVARFAGVTESEDPTPAAIPFAIDVLPPSLHVVKPTASEDAYTIAAWDFVTKKDALVARVRTTSQDGREGAWSEWAPIASMAIHPSEDTASIEVEARDEEGNIGSTSEALIRGRPDPTLGASSAGCGGCTVGSRESRSGGIAAGLALFGGLALMAMRRRTRRQAAGVLTGRGAAAVSLGSICVVAATASGCSCGSDPGTEAPPDAPVLTGCGADCNQPCRPSLPTGLIGAFTSVATAKDGTIWVSGYNDASINPSTGDSFLYGDLVVGKFDRGKQQVMWTSVDGVPAPSEPSAPNTHCPENDPKGWRGGISDNGDDVGLWTSLVIGADDHPMVSYYDATHVALKFASFDGTAWSTHAVLANVGMDAGRYAKMIAVDGKPVIATLVLEKGQHGHTRSRIAVAHANVATPKQPGDWALEDALVDESGPCRPEYCDSKQACVKSTGLCTATIAGCTPADCGGSGNACISVDSQPSCQKTSVPTDVHIYPEAVGDYVSLASGPQGLGIVLYDRIHGNLVGLSQTTGHWQAAVLDGESGSRTDGTAKDTGDVGAAASVTIDAAGDWHIAYVNGITEALQYLRVPKGKLVQGLTPQVIDDGKGVAGKPHADGQHIIGDDARIAVDDNGTVRVAYQDSTAGTLRIASNATGHWDLKAIAQPGKFAGFFPQWVPGEATIANHWRSADATTKDQSGDVAFVTP